MTNQDMILPVLDVLDDRARASTPITRCGFRLRLARGMGAIRGGHELFTLPELTDLGHSILNQAREDGKL